MLKRISSLLLILPFFAIADAGVNQQAATQPDNTKINKRDKRSTELTAQDQSMGTAEDVELTRKIRSLITDDDSLSTYAHNVKIITLNGYVTLKGPVKNADEKATVELYARKFAQNAKINNQLELTKGENK
jgi:osmotically-inducible protein OsmY